MEPTFDIFLSGELEAGSSKETVAAAFAQQFSVTTETALSLLDGKRHRIKSKCTKDAALRYRQALAKIGAKVVIARCDEPVTNEQPSTASSNEPLLAPLGSLLVMPRESIKATVAVPDLSIAEVGDVIPTLVSVVTPANPDTSHLALEPMTRPEETRDS